MKNISSVLALLTLLIVLAGCQEQTDALENIILHPTESGLNKIMLEDKESIQTISEAVNGAKKVPGIVNVSQPQYHFELGNKTYFIWIDEKSGAIMDMEDTNTLYTLSESSAKDIGNLISEIK